MNARARLPYAGLSDVGRVRSHNEDALVTDPPLFAVADGLGGHQAGEVASSLAVETLVHASPRRPDAKALGRAVRTANRAVIEAAESGRGRTGMGTTMTAAMVEGLRIAIAHVGDSRAYLLHRGGLRQLTEDHSMVADMVRAGQLTEEESRVHPNRSVITRALGSDPNLVVDTFEVDAEEGDRLLLCTDGLTGMLVDAEIARILAETPNPDTAVQALVSAANAAGGHDNITAVLVDLSSDAPTEPVRAGAKRTMLAIVAWVLAAVAFVGLAGWGAWAYARSRAYVTAEDGYVVVYRGVPGEFAGVQLHWRTLDTTIPVSSLDPVQATRVERGVPVDGLVQAYEYVDSLRGDETSPAPTP